MINKLVKLNKLWTENDKLREKNSIIESQLHNLKNQNFNKSEELWTEKAKLVKVQKDFEIWKIKFLEEKNKSVRSVEKPLKAKVKSLEYEIKILKDKISLSKYFLLRITIIQQKLFLLFNLVKQQYELSKNSDQILQTMDSLSKMILSKTNDKNFLSSEQKVLIKSLFGDFATQWYKKEISILKNELKSYHLNRENEIKDWIRHIEALQSWEDYKNDIDLKIEKAELISQLQTFNSSVEKTKLKGSFIHSEFSDFGQDEGRWKSDILKSPATLFKPELDFSDLNLMVKDNDYYQQSHL